MAAHPKPGYIFDVGQGLFALFRPSRDSLIIYDCGGEVKERSSSSKVGFLTRRPRAMRELTIIISHGHQDHLNLLSRLGLLKLLISKRDQSNVRGDKFMPSTCHNFHFARL